MATVATDHPHRPIFRIAAWWCQHRRRAPMDAPQYGCDFRGKPLNPGKRLHQKPAIDEELTIHDPFRRVDHWPRSNGRMNGLPRRRCAGHLVPRHPR